MVGSAAKLLTRVTSVKAGDEYDIHTQGPERDKRESTQTHDTYTSPEISYVECAAESMPREVERRAETWSAEVSPTAGGPCGSATHLSEDIGPRDSKAIPARECRWQHQSVATTLSGWHQGHKPVALFRQ